MTMQFVATTLLLFSVIVDAYTPNHFYPAALLRESPSLFHQRGRSRFHEQKAALVVGPRTQAIRDDGEVTGHPSEFPLLSLREKRLMGIFRCYGWGPGCSDRSLPARSRHDEAESPSSTRSLTALQQATISNGNTKFEPFFTLTSGSTWGPTGKKRNGFRRHSIAEKRLNFLKQILRDMLEDTDEDESRDERRPLGLRSRTKRSAPSNHTRRFLTEVARPQRVFGHSKTISAEKELGFDNYSLWQRS